MKVSKALQKKAKVIAQQPFQISMWLDDPERIDLPKELEAALDQEPSAKLVWQALSVGKKWGICYWVGNASSVETRITLAIEIIRRIHNGRIYDFGKSAI